MYPKKFDEPTQKGVPHPPQKKNTLEVRPSTKRNGWSFRIIHAKDSILLLMEEIRLTS